MKLGIIDIGSNTIRLVVWEIYGNGYSRILDELRESVRIGADFLTPEIPEDKIQGAVETLKKYRRFLHHMAVDRIVVVAADPVRRAPNQQEFLQRVELETGFTPIILDEYEESYLDFRGVTGSMEVENSLMADIGGSSTQLVWIRNNELVESTSIPVGTLNLTEQFHLSGIVTTENHTGMDRLLHGAFSQVPWLRDNQFKTLILVGGSARTIGRMDRYRRHYPLSLTHNYTLEDLDVRDLYNQLMTKTAHARAQMPGLQLDRADIILGALGIIRSLCQVTGLTELRISGKGLREGVLFEHIRSNYSTHQNMLDASLYSVLARHSMETDHPEHVWKLSHTLFEALKNQRDLPESCHDILKCAALLHDIGMSIRYYDHEFHSFYIILNSEIYGLNHREILMAALVASYHRKNDQDLSIAAYAQLINRMDLVTAEKLGLIIALAESFERSLNGLVRDIKVEVGQDTITVTAFSAETIDTEIAEAAKTKDKFRQIFRKELVLVSVVDSPAGEAAGQL